MHNDILNNRVEIKPLNRFERDLAQILIDKEHPLKEIPIWVALPFFRSCKRCFKGGEEASVEKANGIAELFQSINDLEREVTESASESLLSNSGKKQQTQLQKYADVASQMSSDCTYTELCNQLETVDHEEDDKLNKMMDELVEEEESKKDSLL